MNTSFESTGFANIPVCQSCGMPLQSPEQYGKHADGSPNPEYCIYCCPSGEEQMTGTLEDRPVLIKLIAQHESVPVTVQQVVEAAREMRAQKAESLILCLTAPAMPEALAYAAGFDPPIRVIDRQEMIDLAGLCSPATDEDLSRLGKRKKARASPKDWADLVLAPSRARRYFWYGMGMSALALVTGQRFYPVPAAVCLLLFAACKLRAARQA